MCCSSAVKSSSIWTNERWFTPDVVKLAFSAFVDPFLCTGGIVRRHWDALLLRIQGFFGGGIVEKNRDLGNLELNSRKNDSVWISSPNTTVTNLLPFPSTMQGTDPSTSPEGSAAGARVPSHLPGQVFFLQCTIFFPTSLGKCGVSWDFRECCCFSPICFYQRDVLFSVLTAEKNFSGHSLSLLWCSNSPEVETVSNRKRETRKTSCRIVHCKCVSEKEKNPLHGLFFRKFSSANDLPGRCCWPLPCLRLHSLLFFHDSFIHTALRAFRWEPFFGSAGTRPNLASLRDEVGVT